ncbi:MAG: hypothetical protein ACYS8W_19050 [Planctomycetota bacterium]|jgi:hypothetical protein
MRTTAYIATLILFLPVFSGCTVDVSRSRILVDSQNAFHKSYPGTQVQDAELMERHYETPTIISAQVLLSVEKPDSPQFYRYKGRYVRCHYTLTYKKMESGWELVAAEQSR